MTTTIQCANARFFKGEAESDLAGLLHNLSTYTLDRTFEAFGNFIDDDARNERDEPLHSDGSVRFWGNFAGVSCVFLVVSDEPEVIAAMTQAIRANQATESYLDQPPYFDSRKLQIVEHKFSETQGEVELIYDGRRLGQYGETYTIAPGGWRGRGGQFWAHSARGILAGEHAEMRAGSVERIAA